AVPHSAAAAPHNGSAARHNGPAVQSIRAVVWHIRSVVRCSGAAVGHIQAAALCTGPAVPYSGADVRHAAGVVLARSGPFQQRGPLEEGFQLVELREGGLELGREQAFRQSGEAELLSGPAELAGHLPSMEEALTAIALNAAALLPLHPLRNRESQLRQLQRFPS